MKATRQKIMVIRIHKAVTENELMLNTFGDQNTKT